MKKTQVMGILNATPDSFFDKGAYFDHQKALARGFEMIDQGADLIDIGGESTRPFASIVPLEEELKRTLPLVEKLSPYIKISIDTSKIEVAEAALNQGARFINDVTGLKEPKMRELAAKFDAEVCLMHMQGTPQTMQQNPYYPKGIINELLEWFEARIDLCLNAGIQKDKIYIDPGIGFGKTVEDTLTILNHLNDFRIFNCPLLVGISRKSFMSKILKKSSQDLLSTTLAINTIIIEEDVEIIRVHDVKEHRDVVDMITTIKCRRSTHF